MGLGSLIVGVAVGVAAVVIVQKTTIDPQQIIIDTVQGIIDDPSTIFPPSVGRNIIEIIVVPTQIDFDTWQFEAAYLNTGIAEVNVTAKFEIFDSQGRKVVNESKGIKISPGSTTTIFWNSGNLLDASLIDGDFTAVFQIEEKGTFDELAIPETIIFPVVAPIPPPNGVP